jgi:hypothetical protein
VFLLPFLTPFLTAGDYAIYGLILSYAGLVGAFSSLGYIVLFQQSYFDLGESFRGKWSRLLGFQWLYKFLYAALVGVVLYFSLNNRDSHANPHPISKIVFGLLINSASRRLKLNFFASCYSGVFHSPLSHVDIFYFSLVNPTESRSMSS